MRFKIKTTVRGAGKIQMKIICACVSLLLFVCKDQSDWLYHVQWPMRFKITFALGGAGKNTILNCVFIAKRRGAKRVTFVSGSTDRGVLSI